MEFSSDDLFRNEKCLDALLGVCESHIIRTIPWGEWLLETDPLYCDVETSTMENNYSIVKNNWSPIKKSLF